MLSQYVVCTADVTTTLQQRYFLWHGMTFASGDALTFISIVVLAYAAIQAFKTRKATAQQAVLTVLPILFIEFETRKDDMGMDVDLLRMKNDGNGPAFNIRVDDVTFDFLDINDRWTMKMNLKPDHLVAKDSSVIGAAVFDKSGEDVEAADFTTQRIRHRTDRTMSLVVYFKDVTGKRYVTLVETGKGIARVRRPSAPYGLRLKCKYRVWYLVLNFASRHKNNVVRLFGMKIRPVFRAWRAGRVKSKK